MNTETNSISGFTESERKGLLDKVINYLDTANMYEYTSDGFGYSASQKRHQLATFFTNKELKMILAKMNECKTKKVIDYVNLFKNTLTDHNIEKIWQYLSDWRSRYWSGKSLDDFLCGFLGKIRRRRESTIQSASNTMYDRIPAELLRKTSEYLDDNTDKANFLQPIGGRIRRKSRKPISKKNKHRISRNRIRKSKRITHN